MTIHTINGITVLHADEGKALKRKDDTSEYATSTEVWLSKQDSIDNWIEVDYCEPPMKTEEN